MAQRILYLHPGWSKTGTSAIQKALHQARPELISQGILYPESLQWKDHAHHEFALAFKPSAGPYRTSLQPQEALDRLEAELISSSVGSAIISSELSPLYFNHPVFRAFTDRHFDEIHLLFTVRRQSELLLSLFAQLVNDPNVRYAHSLFHLFVQNIHWLNFHDRIAEWERHVPAPRITLLPHSDSLLIDVLAAFGLNAPSEPAERVHSSLQPRALLAIQHKCAGITQAAPYKKKRDQALQEMTSTDPNNDTNTLFSVAEQAAVDNFYRGSNARLAKKYRSTDSLFPDKKYLSCKAL
jgi:hypothetical protein